MLSAIAGGFIGLIFAIASYTLGAGITFVEALIIYWVSAAYTTLGLCLRAMTPAHG